MKKLQEFYLVMGYEWESKEKILEKLKESGIEVWDAAVNIEGGQLEVILYFKEAPETDEERRIADELEAAFGIRKGQLKIQVIENGLAAMGDAAFSGAALSGSGTSGIG